MVETDRRYPESPSSRKPFLLGVALGAFGVLCACWIYSRAFPADPYSTRGPFGQGRLKVTQGQYAEALEQLETYQRKHPRGRNISRVGLFRGKAFLGMDQMDRAHQVFDETVRRHPETLEAHKCAYKSALVDFWQGNEKEALERFSRLAQHPDGPLAPEARAWSVYLRERIDSD